MAVGSISETPSLVGLNDFLLARVIIIRNVMTIKRCENDITNDFALEHISLFFIVSIIELDLPAQTQAIARFIDLLTILTAGELNVCEY